MIASGHYILIDGAARPHWFETALLEWGNQRISYDWWFEYVLIITLYRHE